MISTSSRPGVASPLDIASTSSPWAMRPSNGVFSRTHGSSVCSRLKSPETPANAMMSLSVTVRPAERNSAPGARSSR